MMRGVVFGAAMLLVARAAIAQESLEFLSTDRETAAQLTRIVTSARERGLPTEPIVAKARQGVLLHAAAPRIVAAAQAVSQRLDAARTALAPSPTESDIAAGQDALSISGVTPDMLRTIRAVRPNRPVAVPIGVMAQLVASGVSPGHATRIVTGLVRNGAKDEQLVALGNEVNDDVARGASALGSLEVRLARLTPLLAPAGGFAAQPTLSAPVGGNSGGPKRP